ncbi:hypothetical protein J5N97_005602 [Dioscorea zingiberensis]|uniref:SHSP domain-containing protein n=1 Tax=Dioscorea zingiberensis TaxID=325984 RepID=A0A9D5D8D1_9LILI|nr:hypothetical protein J5N97_005602 [Dioscorea zingiberensis]
MDPATIVSTVGIVASPVLQVALDRLVAHLSKDQSSPSDFEDALARLRLSMSNTALLRAAESTPSPDAGLLDLLRQLKDASHSAEDLLDDLEYLALHLQAQSYTHSLSLRDRTFDSQPSRARSAPQREAVGGESGQEEAAVTAPSFLDAIMAMDWGEAVRAFSGGRSDQVPAGRSRTAISLPDRRPRSSTISTSTASSSQASQRSAPPQMQFPKASEHPSSSTQIKKGFLQQQEMTYRQTMGERIIKTAEKLELLASRLEKSISLEKLANDLTKLPEVQSQHLSSSVVIQHEVFGRVLERQKKLSGINLQEASSLLSISISGILYPSIPSGRVGTSSVYLQRGHSIKHLQRKQQQNIMADLLFGSPFRRLIWSSPILRDWPGSIATPMDWIETPSSHIFKFNVPGFGRDDIKVQLEEGNILHITGSSPASKEEHGKDAMWHLSDRGKEDFSRRFELPENVRADQIKAQVENGVLSIVVPKEPIPAKPKPRTIAVTSKL